MVPSFNAVPAPKCAPKDFPNYEGECRKALGQLVTDLFDAAVSAGWERRTEMFAGLTQSAPETCIGVVPPSAQNV